jgi:putative addiction module killer protein
MMYEIDIYLTESGKEPFVDWKDSLDITISTRIEARIARIRSSGNLGDYKALKEGVYELRLDFGPGYRVYFGLDDGKKKIIILLVGGAKKTQQKDIDKAKLYWQDHLSRQRR